MARPTKDKKTAKGRYLSPMEDVQRRLAVHNKGGAGSAKTTRSMRPLVLSAFVTGFKTEGQALAFEKSVKLHGVQRSELTPIQKKFASFLKVLNLPKWMPYSDPASDVPLTLHIVNTHVLTSSSSEQVICPDYVSIVHH
jgi:predicted GIY-YIG superfamily endonuclease